VRPLTREQRLQNRAFLKALRRTGNIRLAAREVGLKYGTVQHRRRTHPAFAQECAAALAFAQARLNAKVKGGRHGSESRDVDRDCSATRRPAEAVSRRNDARSAPLTLRSAASHRTSGGEPHLVRLPDGTIQIKRAVPGRLTREAEQAFLLALSATCNVTLAAAAVGASPRAFYRRKKQCPAFAREMRMALQRGYDALELALMESSSFGSKTALEGRKRKGPLARPFELVDGLEAHHAE